MSNLLAAREQGELRLEPSPLQNGKMTVGLDHWEDEEDGQNPGPIEGNFFKQVFHHLKRGGVPQFHNYRYIGEERKALPEDWPERSARYATWRKSIMVVLTVFMLAAAVVTWVDWANCKWEMDTVDPKCDPLPPPYQTKEFKQLFNQFYNTAYVTSFLPPIFFNVSYILVCVSLFRWTHIDLSRKLIAIAFGLNFALPFVLQLLPYRTMTDVKQEFGSVSLIVVGETAGEFCTVGEGIATADNCLSFGAVCTEAQRLQTLESGGAELEEADKDALAGINTICKTFFNTGCTDKITLNGVKQYAIECPEITTYIQTFWETFMGSTFGAVSFKTLAPVALSLLPGLTKGAITAKKVVPASPVIGMFLLIKPFLYIPLLLAFSVGFYQAVGDVFVLLAIFALATAQSSIVWYGRDLFTPITYEQLVKATTRVSMFSLIWLAISFIFFMVFISLNVSKFDIMQRLGMPEANLEFRPIKVVQILVVTLSNFFFLNLVFSDTVLRVGTLMSEQAAQLDKLNVSDGMDELLAIEQSIHDDDSAAKELSAGEDDQNHAMAGSRQ